MSENPKIGPVIIHNKIIVAAPKKAVLEPAASVTLFANTSKGFRLLRSESFIINEGRNSILTKGMPRS